jgi:hypothetical protein
MGEQLELITEFVLLLTPGFGNHSTANTVFPSAYVPPLLMKANSLGTEEEREPMYSETDFNEIQKIMTRPRWHTLWTWQEGTLDHRKAIVQCGTETVR